MADDSANFQQLVLNRLEGIEQRLDRWFERADQMFARESDCHHRHERENEARADGLKRVWRAMDEHKAAIEANTQDLAALREDRAEDQGRRVVNSRVLNWVLGVLTVALGTVLAAQFLGGCS